MQNADKNAIALVENVRLDLAAATTFDEVLDIRNKCEAAKYLARAAAVGLETQNAAAELKIRAERKLGQFLSELNLRGGSRSGNGNRRLKLNDIGIQQHQSKRWQKIASLPEEAFDQYVKTANEERKEISSAAVRRLADQFAGKKEQNKKKAVFDDRDSCCDASEQTTDNEPVLLVEEIEERFKVFFRLISELIEAETPKKRTLLSRYMRELTEQIETMRQILLDAKIS